jgi:hypothetical protein
MMTLNNDLLVGDAVSSVQLFLYGADQTHSYVFAVYTHTHVYMYISMYTFVYYTHTNVCMYVCIYVYFCMYRDWTV